MTTWLVTGGAGFIGGNFVLDAVQRGVRSRQPRCAHLCRQPRHAVGAGRRSRPRLRAWRHRRPRPGRASAGRAPPRCRRQLRRREPRRPLDRRPGRVRADQRGRHAGPAGSRARLLARARRRRRERVPLPARVHRRGLRLARRHRQVHRRDAVRAELAVLGVQGRVRPPGARLPPHLRAAGADHQLLEQLRPVPVPGKAHPADHRQGAGRRAAAGVRRRHATCATGCTSTTTAPRSAPCWSAAASARPTTSAATPSARTSTS